MCKKLVTALKLDMVMLGCLLAGLAYPLTGNRLHEILGLTFVLLCGAHVYLNKAWYTSLNRKWRTPLQKYTTIVTLLLSVIMILFMGSSVLQSQTVFPIFMDFQTIETRKLHTSLAWWLFIMVGMHVGIHWSIITSALKKWTGLSKNSVGLLHIVSVAITAYGSIVFFERDIPSKLFGLSSFEYNDDVCTSYHSNMCLVHLIDQHQHIISQHDIFFA